MSGFVIVIFLYLKNHTQWQKLVYAQNKFIYLNKIIVLKEI